MKKMKSIVATVTCFNLVIGSGILCANATDKNIDACESFRGGQDYIKAIQSGKKAIKSSPKSFKSHLCLGAAYDKSGEYKLAIPELKKAEILATSKEELTAVASFLGGCYSSLGNKDAAEQQYNRTLTLNRELGNTDDIAVSLNNLAGIYLDLNQSDKALEYYQEALSVQQDELKSGVMYGNIAMILIDKNKLDEAAAYIHKSIAISERTGNFHDQAIFTIKLGNIQYEKKDYQSAETTLLEGLKRIVEVGDAYWEASALHKLGWTNEAIGKKTIAAEYYKKALEISTRIGAKDKANSVQEDLNNLKM